MMAITTNTSSKASIRRCCDPGSFCGFLYSLKGFVFSASSWSRGHSRPAPRDYSAARAKLPTRRRETTRAGPQPRLRIQNKSEHSGRPAETAAISGLCKVSASSWPRISSPISFLTQAPEQSLNLLIQPGELQIQNRLAGMQDQIQGARHQTQPAPHRCAQAAADAVALHGAAQKFAHGETHARAGRVIAFAVKQRHVTGKMFLPLFVNRLKVSMLQQPRSLWKLSRRWSGGVVSSLGHS